MSTVQKAPRRYVVGGPVQPDRPAYVLRDADAELYARLADGEYCHVLAPIDTGKSSLVAHAAARLRADGVAVATVDLAEISSRDVDDDVARWYYSVAYRLMRELRIRADIQSWWQERSGLTNLQRLREFLLDIVLADTDGRIVIFVDRVETVLGREASRDLLGAIRACHDARATEPEYRRLCFALLGSPSVGQRLPVGPDSPFDVTTPVALGDFGPDELARLAEGLPCDAGTMRAVSDRVWYWTAGHPYLSQKLFRALARRRAGSLAAQTVDELVASLFFTPNATRGEPHLALLARELLEERAGRVARLSLYGKVRKGAGVEGDRGLRVHRDLLNSGLLVVAPSGQLAPRNRVYAGVFTAHWVNQQLPLSWRGLSVAALALAFALVVPVWYTDYLPRPFVRALSAPDTPLAEASEAYARLARLPGFAGTAERLYTEYLLGRTRQAARLDELEPYASALAALPAGAAPAIEARAGFWDRARSAAMDRGDRDAALLYAVEALAAGPTPQRRAAAGELVGADFASLAGTLRPGGEVEAVELDPRSGLVTVLEAGPRVSTWQLADGGLRPVREYELVAEAVIPLQGRRVFDTGGAGRRLVLALTTDHPRPADVVVELRSPAGRLARLALEPAAGEDGRFLLDSRRYPALRALLEDSVGGTWTAYFADTVPGVGGVLVDWQLEIDGTPGAEVAAPTAGSVPIPEPGIAAAARAVLAPGGRRALSWPADPAVRGEVLVWNVASGDVTARLPRPPGPTVPRFALDGRRVLLERGRALELWELDPPRTVGTIPLEPELRPVLSTDGRFLVVDSIDDASGENALAVWDLETGQAGDRLVTGTVAALAAIDPTGRLLGVSDGDRLVRLWALGEGNRLVGEYQHASTPVAIRFDGTGRWLATEDAARTVRLWDLERGGSPVLTRRGASPWSIAFDGGRLLAGSIGRGFQLLGLDDGLALGPALRHGARLSRADNWPVPDAGRLAGEAGLALSWDGERSIKLWRLPPPAGPAVEAAGWSSAAGGVAALSPGGGRLAVATAAGDVRIVDAGEPALLRPGVGRGPGFIGHLSAITAVRFDADGGRVASGALDGTLRVWDARSGSPLGFYASHGDGAVQDLAFLPDGSALVSVSRQSVAVFDATTGELLARRPVQGERPRLDISADGRHVYVAGDRDGLTRWLWRGDASEGLVVAESAVRHVAVAAVGGRLATADAEWRVRLWVGETGAQPVFVRLPAAVDRLWFDATGRHVLALAGHWVFRLVVTRDGLRHAETRMLDAAPVAATPTADGRGLVVLVDARGARPVVERIPLTEPAGPAIEDDLAAFRARIAQRLALAVDATGVARPVRP